MLRLRRICSAVGNNAVRFVSCSATVANPESHMRTIFGLDTESVKLTDQDGSPSGRKEFLCWNTPFKDPNDPTSGRGDSLVQTARLFTQLILRGVRAIAFCRVRTVCELMLQAVRGELQKLGRNDVAQRVMSYRGGYTPQDRRRIEKEMFEGHLLGIVATNALELGVDIGSLDAVLMVNFPSSISAFRQQSGRAGRRNKDSLSVLVGGSFPIDQHYMTHPSELFSKPNTALALDLQSVRDGHLQCAAHEMPIHPLQDQKYFGAGLPELAESQLVPDLVGFYHSHPSFHPYPPRMVAIRDTEDPGYAVVDIARNIVLEELEASRAIFSLYEGGIFLHQGRTYLIRTVSTEQRIARVEAVNVSWTTSPRDFTDVDPVQTLQTCPPASFGKIKVETHVFGFFKMDKQKRILDSVDVDTPPLIEQTQGFWINMDENTLLLLRRRKINAAAAIHSAQHAVLALLPESDLRTECKAPEKEWAGKKTSRRRPARLVFYERRAGTGASRVGFGAIGGILERARERVEGCRCREGCAECCLGSRCSEGMRVVSKRGAGVVLRAVLGVEEPEEEVEVVEEKGWDSGSVVPVWSTGIGGAGRGLVLEDASDVGEPSRLANCVL